MVLKPPAFSTQKLLKSQNTDIIRAKKRFVRCFHFFPALPKDDSRVAKTLARMGTGSNLSGGANFWFVPCEANCSAAAASASRGGQLVRSLSPPVSFHATLLP